MECSKNKLYTRAHTGYFFKKDEFWFLFSKVFIYLFIKIYFQSNTLFVEQPPMLEVLFGIAISSVFDSDFRSFILAKLFPPWSVQFWKCGFTVVKV